MAKDLVIKLSKANQIFPKKYTKVRYEDIVGILSEKSNFISKSEYEKAERITDTMEKTGNFEFMVKREGKRLIFKPI